MTKASSVRSPADLAKLHPMFRPRELEALGIPRSSLRSWLRQGMAEQLGRGLYRLIEAEPTEYETLAMVSARVPQAVVCLLTALRVHGIGTQSPRDVWIAIDRKARKPRLEGLSIHVVRFSPAMLTYAVQSLEVQGVQVHVTSPARTVVDCFRYRNKVGLDVAIEALRDTLRSRLATINEILGIAEVGRVRQVIQPYVEAVAS